MNLLIREQFSNIIWYIVKDTWVLRPGRRVDCADTAVEAPADVVDLHQEIFLTRFLVNKGVSYIIIGSIDCNSLKDTN
mgnify:CR=1 FL=1